MAEWKYNLKPFKQVMNWGPAAVRSGTANGHEMAALSSALTVSPPSPLLISALLGRNIVREEMDHLYKNEWEAEFSILPYDRNSNILLESFFFLIDFILA